MDFIHILPLAILLIFIIVVVCIVLSNINEQSKIAERGCQLAALEKSVADFTPSVTVSSAFSTYRFSIDQERRKILILQNGDNIIIPFDKILSVTIKEDNEQIMSKSSSRTIGGALVGGLIAGEAGAIVGGLSGGQKVKKRVALVQVVFKLRDMARPSISIDCFDAYTMGCDPFECNGLDVPPLYNTIIAEAQKIVDLVGVIIDQVDKEEKAKTPIAAAVPKSETPAIEELEKLAALMEKGFISQDEFNEKKKVILSRI